MTDLTTKTELTGKELERYARILRSPVDDLETPAIAPEQMQRYRMIAAANQGGRTFMPGYQAPTLEAEDEGDGFFDRYVTGGAKQLVHGLISTIPQSMIVLGSLVDAAADAIAGQDVDADFMAESGISFQNWLDDNVAVENPEFYHHLMGGIGSMLSLLVPGVGAAGAAGKLATGMKLGDKAAKYFKLAFGSGVMSVLEAGVEQGQLQQELMESGMTTGEALAESKRIFWLNLPMLAVTNAGYFHPASRVARVLLEAPTEGAQERYQGVVQDVVAGRGKWSDFLDWRKYQTETAVGAIVGGGAAAIMPAEGGKKPEDRQDSDQAPDEFEGDLPEGATQERPERPASGEAPEVVDGGEPPLGAEAGPQGDPFAAEPQDRPVNLDDMPAVSREMVQTAMNPKEAEIMRQREEIQRGHQRETRERHRSREQARLERFHAEQDETDRVIGQEWDDARMMQELEQGLIDEYGVEFSLKERLGEAEYNKLLDMVKATYAERDGFKKMDMIEATVARAKGFLFGGETATGAVGSPSTGEVTNGGIDASPVPESPAGPTKAAPAQPKEAQKPKPKKKPAPSGSPATLSGNLGLHLTQYSTGKWGFAGSVPVHLTYTAKDGSPLTDDQIAAVRQVGPGIAGVKSKTWGSAEEALAAADEMSAEVTDRTAGGKYAPVAPAKPKKKSAPAPAGGRWQVRHVPMGEVTFRRDELQNREAAFSERTASAVAESYDERLMDPVDMWRDPDTGELVMVEGHSRFEGMERRQAGTIPAFIYEDMTFEEAQKLAAEKNKSRDVGNVLDDVKLLRNEVKRGELNKGQVKARAKELFERNATTVMALMHLNPKGKLISTLRSMQASSDEGLTEIRAIAKWVGAVRQQNPELTNAHEREMTDDLLANYKKKKAHQSEAAYKNFIYNRTTSLLGFDYSQPLNLKDAVSKSPAVAQHDALLDEAKATWIEAQRAHQEKMDEFKSMPIELQEKALKPYYDETLITKKEYEDLKARRGDVKDAAAGEKTLFRITVDTLSASRALQYVRKLATGMGIEGEITATNPQGAEFSLVRRVGKLFGAEVSFFQTTEGADGIGGVYSGNRILLNENSDVPLIYVLMHEVGHFMEVNHPDLWKLVADTAMRHVTPGGWEAFKQRAMMRGAKSVEQARKEFVSDAIAEAAMRESFWRDLKATDPQGFSLVVQKIRDVLATIRKFLVEHNESIAHYFDNFAAVEMAIAKATKTMAKRTKEAAVAERTAREEAAGQGALFRLHIPKNASPEMAEKLTEQHAAEKAAKTKRSWSGTWHYIYTHMVDDRHPLFLGVRNALKATGQRFLEYEWVKNPYRIVQALSGWHGKAELNLEEVVKSWDGKTTLSDGLEVIISKFGLAEGIESGEMGQFVIAARLHALYEELGESFIGDDPASPEFAHAWEKYQEYERIYNQYSSRKTGAEGTWKDAVDAITKYANAVMERGVGAGMISQEAYDRLVSKYGVYAPLYVLDMVDTKGQWAGGRPKAFAGKPFFEQGRFIPDAVRMDPFDAIIKNTYKLEFMFGQNEAKMALADFIKEVAPKSWSVVGLGRKIEPKQRPWQKTGETLMKAMGFNAKQIKSLTTPQLGGLMQPAIDPQTLEDVHNIWTISSWQEEGTIALMRDGKVEYWQVDPELVHIFASGPRGMGHQFMKFFTTQTALLRAGAILTPDFMGRNVTRDFLSASIIATNLVDNPIDAVMLPFRILRGVSHSMKKSELWQEWILTGGAHAQLVAVDQVALRKRTEDLTKGHGTKERLKYGVKSPAKFVVHSRPDKAILHSLQYVSSMFENATRLAVYEKTRNGLLGSGVRESEAKFRAMIESREASLDFNRMGKTGAVINQLRPFFNASMQGHDKLVRSLLTDKGRRGKTWLKGVAMLTMPSILLWAINKDEEWYDDMPLWMKNHFWLFSLDGGKTIHKVPKPYEVAMLFASMPERFLDYAYKKDKKALDALAGDWLDMVATFKPWELAGPIAYTTSEMLANYDSFRDAPIVKGRMQDLEAKQQYTGRTTEIAKEIGKLVGGEGWSPAKIDHFIRGSFGGLGHMAAELTSTFIYMADPSKLKVRPEARKFYGVIPDWMPVARAFLETSPPTYSRYKQDFYEMLDESTEATNTLKHFLSTGADPSAIGDLYRRRYVELGMHEGLSRVSDKLGKIHGAIRTIDYDRSGRYSREQKQQRRDELYKMGNDLVRKAVKQIEIESEKARKTSGGLVEIEALRLEAMGRRQRANLKGK